MKTSYFPSKYCIIYVVGKEKPKEDDFMHYAKKGVKHVCAVQV